MWPALVVLALVSCAPAGPPLYSPISEAGTFGYAEERLADDRFRVTYAAPRMTTFVVSRFDNAAIAEQRLALAHDIALLRAADVAGQSGWTHFIVVARDNDTRVEVVRERDFYGPRVPRPFYRYDRFPYDRFGDRDYAVINATVGLTVERRSGTGTNVFGAAATRRRLQATYPDALPAGGPG